MLRIGSRVPIRQPRELAQFTDATGAPDSPISASDAASLAFSCTCNEVGWDLCAASVREPSTARAWNA